MNPSARTHTVLFRRYFSGFFHREDSGYSIVEMLVVMAILTVLMSLAWAGFYGMRTSMLVIQNMETLRADIVNAQRSAMLLDRSSGEMWIYGIGVDMSSLDDGSNTYTVFKWCSPDPTYQNFDDGANIPGNRLDSCTGDGYAPIPGKEDVTFIGGSLDAEFYAENLAGEYEKIDIILFEAVRGTVHFYRKDTNGLGVPITDGDWASVNLYKKTIDDRIVIRRQGLVFTQTGNANPIYCVPDCAGKQCGDNGCGSPCGICKLGGVCNEELGICEVGCVPDCKNKICGDDGCGGSCGDCLGPKGTVCVNGLCVCSPVSCTGRECGDDGCGGSCGTCQAGYSCNLLTYQCEYTGCDPVCEYMPDYCGDDGCGSKCVCPPSFVCDVDSQTCIPEESCVPYCTGRYCGPDTCGGSCGACIYPSVCDLKTGQCIGSALN